MNIIGSFYTMARVKIYIGEKIKREKRKNFFAIINF